MKDQRVLLDVLRVELCAPHLVSLERRRRQGSVHFWAVLDLGERQELVTVGNVCNPGHLNQFRYRRAWEARYLAGERTSFPSPPTMSAADGRRIRRLMHEIADLDAAVTV